MGSVYQANCDCGFSTKVKVGGNMRDFRKFSYFPFYCSRCGIVNVNFRNEPLSCPTCFSKDIVQYGDLKISEPTTANKAVQAWNFHCGIKGHLCPSCGSRNLRFNGLYLSD